ncbi:Argininosuccinate lyase [Variovorax sp. PBL-H6]|uniref:tripartite tricarboxylate transporter substrate binding protein n=1 Tax=Variovorax sp. PBL-H6 TaxID=434009 RepID=UPI001315F29B|nr:tripartite tricarboxylate transporter substrate binding protein [Variovorax sp. PBL-H6]VTU33338.1 Argininosuccinate lyase [Variovorax sp. PBL-H6]
MKANLTARNARALLTFALPLLAAAAVHAQALWKPDHPVTLVVPYAAGGGTDVTARAVSRQLAVLWGEPVVVENLPGADGLIGTRRVMDARPDGHTLLLQVPSLVLMKYTPGMKGIDPLARLEPVTAIAQAPNAFVVSSKLPVRTLPELFQYCRTSRKPCSVGAGENIGRLTGKRLAAESGVPDLIVVSYRGTAAIVQDLIAGNLDFAVTGITAALPHHRAGTLRIVATQGPRRAAVLPEVPTTAETGSPQYDSVSWFGLFAPRGTPARITTSIVVAVREAVNDAGVLKAVSAASAEPVANSPVEFADLVRKEDKKLGALAQQYPIE